VPGIAYGLCSGKVLSEKPLLFLMSGSSLEDWLFFRLLLSLVIEPGAIGFFFEELVSFV
jgi:hypothetical protein